MGGEELKIGSLDISFTEFGHEGKWKNRKQLPKGECLFVSKMGAAI